MSEPNTPPVPPVPNAPAVPQYGEFAPVEASSAAAVPSVEPAAPAGPATPAGPAYGQPTYGQPPYGQPAYGDPGYAQQAPQYAQQQPLYAQNGAGPVYGQAGFNNPLPPRRRTWDLVLTVILLVIGALGAFGGIINGIMFSDPEILDQAFREQGMNGFNGDVGATPAIIIGSHVILYLLAVGLSILLLVKRKVAFYVPLSAGVLATIVFWGALFMLMLSDPNFMDTATR